MSFNSSGNKSDGNKGNTFTDNATQTTPRSSIESKEKGALVPGKDTAAVAPISEARGIVNNPEMKDKKVSIPTGDENKKQSIKEQQQTPQQNETRRASLDGQMSSGKKISSSEPSPPLLEQKAHQDQAGGDSKKVSQSQEAHQQQPQKPDKASTADAPPPPLTPQPLLKDKGAQSVPPPSSAPPPTSIAKGPSGDIPPENNNQQPPPPPPPPETEFGGDEDKAKAETPPTAAVPVPLAQTPSKTKSSTSVKSKKDSEKKKNCCKKCCKCCGCCKKCSFACCKGLSLMLWLLLIVSFVMAIHLIWWEGCGVTTLKFVEVFDKFQDKRMLGFLCTVLYFLYFWGIMISFIFCKTCLVPINRQRTCTCKELKLALHIALGAALCFFLLTMTQLPDTYPQGKGPSPEGKTRNHKISKREAADPPPTPPSPSTPASATAAPESGTGGSPPPPGNGGSGSGGDGDDNKNKLGTRRYGQLDPHGSVHQHLKRPNMPDFDNMDCIGRSHLYEVILLLMGVVAFVLFSLERRRLRRVRPVDAEQPQPSVTGSELSRMRSTSRSKSKISIKRNVKLRSEVQ